MDFKKLNEELHKIVEGDVVSFADYKQRKHSQEVADNIEKELSDGVKKQLENTMFIDINKIKVIWAEGRIDGKNTFVENEELSYEDFQTKAYELNYINKKTDHMDKVKYDAYLTIVYQEQKEDTKYTGYLYVGQDHVNVIKQMTMVIKDGQPDLDIIVRNDEVFEDDVNFNNMKFGDMDIVNQELAQKEKEEQEKQNNIKAQIAKAPKQGKTAQEVEIGDIITVHWGYSMSLVDFYKVVKRTKGSIGVRKLEDIIVSGDGMRGRIAPTNKEKDSDVDGKLFRIGAKWSKDVVCQINGHAAYYWDGAPKSVDRWD